MKVAMQVEVSIAANTTNKNVFSTEQYMTIPYDALLELLDTGSAAGLRRSLSVGGQSILADGVVNTSNRVPQPDLDTVISGVEAYQGNQVFCSVQNTTAGALTYRATLWIEQAVRA